jgi:hypothetical protein
MTLAELKSKADKVKLSGRVVPDNLTMVVYQEMVFDKITQLCEPLNLAIPYQDSNIYRHIEYDDIGTEWLLKKPTIANNDGDYIDIDSRLELAFIYYTASLFAVDKDRAELEYRADRICYEYSAEVLRMGFPRAKEVYEMESFIDSVWFDCVGRRYGVESSFITTLIDCMLCGNVCHNAHTAKQINLYKSYIAGESINPLYIEQMRAIDREVFNTILNDQTMFTKYTPAQLSSVTTLWCSMVKIDDGVAVDTFADETNKRYVANILTQGN